MSEFYNLSDWRSRFLKGHVQASEIDGGDFLSAETVVLVSGPPEITDEAETNRLVPIGLVQNVQITQQKQLQQLFEIGSRKPFFIPGRTIITAGMSRILFDGPSLMYALYIQKTDGNRAKNAEVTSYQRNNAAIDNPTLPVSAIESDSATSNVVFDNDGSLDADPGYFFSNLASSFFNKPLGLGFMLYDGEQDAYGGFYLENAYIQQHTFAVSSQQTVLVENVSLRTTSLRPIQANSIDFGGPAG